MTGGFAKRRSEWWIVSSTKSMPCLLIGDIPQDCVPVVWLVLRVLTASRSTLESLTGLPSTHGSMSPTLLISRERWGVNSYMEAILQFLFEN